MNVQKKLKEMKNQAFKHIRLSDGRYGIIFIKGKDAENAYVFLKKSGLSPTTLNQTKYGWAFKFNDVSTLKRNWPHSMLPPAYDPEIHGQIYRKWDYFKYIGYDSHRGEVHVFFNKPIKGGRLIKPVKIAFPPTDDWGGDAYQVLTAIRPMGYLMGSAQLPYYKFTSYLWSLLPDNGNWLCKVTDGMCPVGNDEIGQFITNGIRSGATTYGRS